MGEQQGRLGGVPCGVTRGGADDMQDTLRRAVPMLAGVAAMLAASCAPYRVHTDYDEQVSFSSIRTFAWMDTTRRDSEAPDNPFLERRVRRAVELVMRERGLTEAQPQRSDVLVTAFVIGPSGRERRPPRWSATMCGPSVSIWIGPSYPFGFSRRRVPWLFRSPYWRDPWGDACTYRIGFGYVWLPLYDAPGSGIEGTLVIDILDRSSRELLWRGSAEGLFLDPRRGDQDQETIDRVVRDVLSRFPPRGR